MKATKFVVGGGALVGIAACFMDWATLELNGPGQGLAAEIPTAGMDQGGPVFIFLLAFPLIAAIVGITKRMGRGMGVMAFIGGLLSTLVAMVKQSDISDGSALIESAGLGELSVAGGFYLLLLGSLAAMVGGLIALIKPEPKPN